MHKIFVVDSAAEDFKILPEASRAQTLEWLKKELSASRAKNGTALKGALQGFYAVS
jgi:mRNA-degrading endonuclease RelE of RelBE toxin-antitoxin system